MRLTGEALRTWAAQQAAKANPQSIGIAAFEKRWGVSLKVIARQLTEVYEAGLKWGESGMSVRPYSKRKGVL